MTFIHGNAYVSVETLYTGTESGSGALAHNNKKLGFIYDRPDPYFGLDRQLGRSTNGQLKFPHSLLLYRAACNRSPSPQIECALSKQVSESRHRIRIPNFLKDEQPAA